MWSHQPAKSWPPYSGILKELYWLTYLEHGTTITGTYYVNLIRKCLAALKEKRRGKLRHGVPCLLICHLKHWLPPELPVSNRFATHRIRQICPPVTCFQNWKKSWKDGNLMTTVMLSAPWMAGWRTKIKNSSTTQYGLWRIAEPSAFLLKETMLKSDKISSSYSVVNCIRLWTFWTPLVVVAVVGVVVVACCGSNVNNGSADISISVSRYLL